MATGEINYRLCGTVKHMGLPVSGVSITVLPKESSGKGKQDGPMLSQMTGAKGEFSFTLANGNYALDVVPSSSTRFTRKLVDISISNNTICDIILQTGYILNGTMHGQQGQDLSSYCITIDSTDYSVAQELDANGYFDITLPAGRYKLVLRPGKLDFSPSSKPDVPALVTISEVIEISHDLKLDFDCGKVYRFMGLVKDASGKPITGARATVVVNPDDTGTLTDDRTISLTSITDSHGTFFIDLKPDMYQLQIEPPEELGTLSNVVRSITVTQETIEEFVLSPGFLLQGLIGFNGEAVANCRVTAITQNSNFESSACTDEQGQFSLRLPAGAYELKLAAQSDPLRKNSQVSSASWTRSMDVSGDTDIIIELQEGHKVEFEVTDAKGQLLSGCEITYGPYGKEAEYLSSGSLTRTSDAVSGSVRTNDDGVCSLIVAPGVYFFQVSPPDGTTCQAKNIRQLSINATTKRKVTLSSDTETDEHVNSSEAVQLSIQGTLAT